jgi:hypothetical protein
LLHLPYWALGLLIYAASYLLLILGAYLVARLHRRPEQMVHFLVVLMSFGPGFEVVASIFDLYWWFWLD